MRGIFVTGTDTGVGKTLVTGLLAKFLKQQGYRVITQKWIETGCKNLNKSYSLRRPYCFSFAASPHLAASREKKIIQETKIKKSSKLVAKNFDFVIVEGIGGALVPFSKKRLVIDIVKDLKFSSVVVIGNKLGAINHSLLTIEALRKRKIKIIGLIFNNLRQKENKIILKDNVQIIKTISREKILGILPYSRSTKFLYKRFIPIGRKLI